jgi:hypothetical protein
MRRATALALLLSGASCAGVHQQPDRVGADGPNAVPLLDATATTADASYSNRVVQDAPSRDAAASRDGATSFEEIARAGGPSEAPTASVERASEDTTSPCAFFSGTPVCPFPRTSRDSRPCIFTEKDAQERCHDSTIERFRCDGRAPEGVHPPQYLLLVQKTGQVGTYVFNAKSGALVASMAEQDGGLVCGGSRNFTMPDRANCDELGHCFGSTPY